MDKSAYFNDLSNSELPYERFRRFGASALSDAELLAVILRSGTKGCSALSIAHALLKCCPYKKGLKGIFHLTVHDLQKLNGIGEIKAIQLVCIGELAKRAAAGTYEDTVGIGSPGDAASYYMERLRYEEQEHVFCMMLDTKNRLIEDVCLSKGTVNISLISPREVFIQALNCHAVRIILVHNHPSGDPTPSSEDIRITDRISKAGAMLGVELIDHIIIGDRRFVSILNS